MLSKKQMNRMSQKTYLFSDFDNDGVKNIDDTRPFNRRYGEPTHNLKYYYRSRLGSDEVKLSDELLAIERYNNARRPFLRKFLRENKNSVGRIKTVSSTLKKLRERYLPEIKDIAGVYVLTDNRKQAKAKFKSIKRRYKYDKKETDDYYSNPKGGVHYAYHTGLQDRKNKNIRLEVQVKSKPMALLQLQMHPYYKRNKPLSRFKKKARNLYTLGY